MATRFVVKGDTYVKIDRRMAEIKRQLLQEGGSPLNPAHIALVLQALVEGRDPVAHRLPFETVVVPDLSAPQLLKRAKARLRKMGCKNVSFDKDWDEWDFLEGYERGKRFEVATYVTTETWTPNAYVHEYFRVRGLKGNTAAYLCWIAETQPFGTFITLPDKVHGGQGGFFREEHPYFGRWGDYAHLVLTDMHEQGKIDWKGWPAGTVFVAFAEIDVDPNA